MVGVDGDGDEGSRRRLPSWMLGVAQQQQPENKNQTKKTGTAISTQQHKATHSNVIVTNKNRSNRLGRKVGQKRKDKSVNDNENDAELTAQDLLSIAREYVEADAVTAEVQSLTTICLEKDSKGSFAAPNAVRTSPTHPSTASCISTSSLTGEKCLLSAATTGDTAQDMLDLFLGPLLKTPLEQEKKMEFTANDMEFSSKFLKPSQNEVREEIVRTRKTKSSLKDKITLLQVRSSICAVYS